MILKLLILNYPSLSTGNQTELVRETLVFKDKTVILVGGRRGGELESWTPFTFLLTTILSVEL